jgi:hypothetical protein
VRPTAQHRRFQQAFVVQMHPHARYREIVAVMMRLRDAPGEIARRVIVDVGERRDALPARIVRGLARLALAHDVAQRLRTARIAACGHQ